MQQSVDVVVVGAGNAGLCAALAAREAGAEVLVLERAPRAERGGNSAFTGGVMRFSYRGADDLVALVPDLSDSELADADWGSYPEETFFADIARVTEYRADPDLADLLVSRSHDTLKWMVGKGVRLTPTYGRQAFKVDGKLRFWGGVPLEVSGGGLGLVDALFAAAEKAGIHISYEARAKELIADDDGVHGVRGRGPDGTFDVLAPSVVLAAGGFQANTEMRTRYLGPGWDLAKVRGTRYDTGDGIKMALDAGAMFARPLVRLPLCGVGPQRAAVRRHQGRRRFQQAPLPVRNHGQRQRRAVRRRGCRHSQLHLCQVRPRHPRPARPVRVADLRPQGGTPVAAGVLPDAPGDQGPSRTR